MKKLYNTPIIEIINFKSEDIIVTSLGDNDHESNWGDEDIG